MIELKETPTSTCYGLEVLEQTVEDIRQKGIQESPVNESSLNGKEAESDMLHCVPPDPQQPPPFWKGAFRRQQQGKFSKNERHRKEIKER